MTNIRSNDLSDRRSAAASAKAALLKSYRAKMQAAEPTRLARQEERLALAAARDERHAERDRKKLEEREQEQKRLQAETAQHQAAADAAANAELESLEKSENLIARVIKDEATRKAERDRRYANRKARQQ